jgi:hypothetical protein
MATPGSHFGDVHATVLHQHEEIRARLRGLDMCTSPGSAATAYLRVSLLRLALLMESHLTFEEQALAPRIRELDAWGSARERAMLIEHAEQRSRLEHACWLAESEQTGELELTREVSSLVVSLLDDMAREERELLQLELLSTDGVLEQMTG